MSSDQCRQLNFSTTNSEGLKDLTGFFNFEGDEGDAVPYLAIEDGHISDIDEQSCLENGGSIDILSEESNSQGIQFPEHYYQRQDLLDIGVCRDRPNMQQGQQQQINGSEEEKPCVQQKEMVQRDSKQEDDRRQKEERIKGGDLCRRRNVHDQKAVKKDQQKKVKAKRIKKRMKQQMKSLGENVYYKFKKNVNMPKAIGRYLIAFHSQFKGSLFKDYVDQFSILSNKLKEKSEWIKKSKKNSFKLQHLKQFFSGEVGARSSRLNRLLMRRIIQSHKKEQIIENNQVKDKLEYLVSSKIFSLRCSNSDLACRMQMR